ncbi:MAG TPA: hypothetical protein VKU41_31455 [Polyangiaceae bacterium]|nr:hypothetical protein [Polyangiaceae bacterium]
MSDLSPEDQTLLGLARDGHDPTDADRRRVRAAVAAQLGAAAGLTVATTSTLSAGAAATGAGAAGSAWVGATTTAAVKVAAAVALVGAVASGGVAAYRATRAPQARVIVAPAAWVSPPHVAQTDHGGDAPPPTALREIPTSPPEPVPAQAPAPLFLRAGERTAPPAPALAAETTWPPTQNAAPTTTVDDPFVPPVVGAGGVATSPPPPASAASSIEAETLLVRAGLAALHAGDPAGALVQFDRHAREFPDGLLAPERDAERIFALCDLRRVDEARAAADAFRIRHPGSPLFARVRTSCALPSNR